MHGGYGHTSYSTTHKRRLINLMPTGKERRMAYRRRHPSGRHVTFPRICHPHHDHKRGRLHSSNHFTKWHGARRGHSLRRMSKSRHLI